MIIAAKPFGDKRGRFHVRGVNEESFAEQVGRDAKSIDDWLVNVTHGGAAPINLRQFRTETECVLAISDPFGNVVYWTGYASGNKPTFRSAAEACFYGAGDLFDEHTNQKTKDYGTRRLQYAHRQIMPAMMVIALAAKE